MPSKTDDDSVGSHWKWGVKEREVIYFVLFVYDIVDHILFLDVSCNSPLSISALFSRPNPTSKVSLVVQLPEIAAEVVELVKGLSLMKEEWQGVLGMCRCNSEIPFVE